MGKRKLEAGVCFCAAVGMKITTAARRELGVAPSPGTWWNLFPISSNLKCECKVVFQCQQVKHDQTCQKHCRPIFNPVLMCDVSELIACVRT